MVRQVDAGRFHASDLPAGRVAVLFCADWCGYCHRFLPFFKKLHQGWVVDASDDDDRVWEAYGLRVVPTVIVFEDGTPAERWEGVLGARHAEEIVAALRAPAAG